MTKIMQIYRIQKIIKPWHATCSTSRAANSTAGRLRRIPRAYLENIG